MVDIDSVPFCMSLWFIGYITCSMLVKSPFSPALAFYSLTPSPYLVRRGNVGNTRHNSEGVRFRSVSGQFIGGVRYGRKVLVSGLLLLLLEGNFNQ